MKDDKVYRLKDIVVEEVSLVDRAANKKKFLIVKREQDMEKNSTEDNATEAVEAAQEATQEEVQVAPEATEQAEAVEAAPESEEAAEAATTEDTEEVAVVAQSEESPEEEAQAELSEQVCEKSSEDNALNILLDAVGGITKALEAINSVEAGDKRNLLVETTKGLFNAANSLAANCGVEVAVEEAELVANDKETIEMGETQMEKSKKEEEVLAAPVDKAEEKVGDEPAATEATSAEKSEMQLMKEALHELLEKFSAVSESVEGVSKAVAKQSERLNNLEDGVGSGNSLATSESVNKSEDSFEGWPLDLNSPYDRETTEKSVSFFDDESDEDQ